MAVCLLRVVKMEGKEFLCVFDTTSDVNCVTTRCPALISSHSGKPRPLKINAKGSCATFGEATVFVEIPHEDSYTGKLMTANVVNTIGDPPLSSSPNATPIDKAKFAEVDVLIGEPQMRLWYLVLDIVNDSMTWSADPTEYYAHLDKKNNKGFLQGFNAKGSVDGDGDEAFNALLLEVEKNDPISEDEAIKSEEEEEDEFELPDMPISLAKALQANETARGGKSTSASARAGVSTASTSKTDTKDTKKGATAERPLSGKSKGSTQMSGRSKGGRQSPKRLGSSGSGKSRPPSSRERPPSSSSNAPSRPTSSRELKPNNNAELKRRGTRRFE